MRVAALCLSALLAACASSEQASLGAAAIAGGKTRETVIASETITESSGLARSQLDPNLLWTHNDSGGNAEGYALDTEGRFLGTLSVSGAANADWEDMASFTRNGQAYLVFADIGDNFAARPQLTLYVVEEPDVRGQAQAFSLSAMPVQVISASYPDGPRDSEGIAVDGAEGAFYLISKRDAQPALYRGALPLGSAPQALVMERLGAINIPRAAAGVENPESINWVTAFDFSQTADAALVLTLTRAYHYPRAAGETWFAALSRPPQAVDIPRYSQTEALSFALGGESFFITSENAPYPLAEIPLP